MAHRGGQGKKIDTVHWTYGSFSALALTAGTVAGTVYAAQHLPETLMRIRGEFVSYLDSASAPPTLSGVGIGLIQVPEGTGTTVLWSPITDGDAPWVWVDYFHLGYEEMVTDVITVQQLIGVRRVIDNKSMRRMRNTELQCVIENATIETGEAINTALQVRTLFGS